MRIHGATTIKSGCFTYRIQLPLLGMRELHDVSYGTSVPDTLADGGVIVGQYLCHPSTVSQWRKWREDGRYLLVYDLDDCIWSVGDTTHAGKAYEDPENIRRMEEMMSLSHLVTVTNQYLANRCVEFNSNVKILPNFVPNWVFDLPSGLDPNGVLNPVLGYPGSPGHSEDFLQWSPCLRAWMQGTTNPNISPSLKFWGCDDNPRGLPAIWKSEFVPWQSYPNYIASLKMSVGVCPLARTDFNYGRSGIKAVELGALGIPVIADDFPQYGDVIHHAHTGFLARNMREWRRYLRILLRDPDLRANIGSNARRHIKGHFSETRWVPEWLATYKHTADMFNIPWTE